MNSVFIFIPVLLVTGSAAVDYVIDHAEIDFVFVQDKKIKGVSIFILFLVQITFFL